MFGFILELLKLIFFLLRKEEDIKIEIEFTYLKILCIFLLLSPPTALNMEEQ